MRGAYTWHASLLWTDFLVTTARLRVNYSDRSIEFIGRIKMVKFFGLAVRPVHGSLKLCPENDVCSASLYDLADGPLGVTLSIYSSRCIRRILRACPRDGLLCL